MSGEVPGKEASRTGPICPYLGTCWRKGGRCDGSQVASVGKRRINIYTKHKGSSFYYFFNEEITVLSCLFVKTAGELDGESKGQELPCVGVWPPQAVRFIWPGGGGVRTPGEVVGGGGGGEGRKQEVGS